MVTVTATTPNTLIQWQSFQVGAGQSVNFVLPSTASTVLNQILGSASFQGPVTPSAQVMFLQNGTVSGGSFASPFDLGNSALAALQLNRSRSGPSRAEERREGLAREIVARLADGQVVVLAPAREDVSTTPSGEVLVAAGRSIELADIHNPSLRVLIRASTGQALNVSQLLTRARSTGVFGVLLAQPRPTQRADTEPAQQRAGVRESRDVLDTLIAYLDDVASRIARLADPAPDLLPTAVASVVAPLPGPAAAPVQVASLAPAMAIAAEPAKPAVVAPVQDIELMESQVSSWQLAVAPIDTELMESQVRSWQLAAAPVDTELMESQVSSWQLAVAPAPAPVVVVAAKPADVAPSQSAAPSADKPMQLASAAPAETQRIFLPERRTTPPKLIRIEFKGGSFFM